MGSIDQSNIMSSVYEIDLKNEKVGELFLTSGFNFTTNEYANID